jgi:hypothetical protein
MFSDLRNGGSQPEEEKIASFERGGRTENHCPAGEKGSSP